MKARKLATDLPNGRNDRLYHVDDLEYIFPELIAKEKVMKENEVPKKIYLSPITLEEVKNVITRPTDSRDIEYASTDAFIEKACEWIREFNNHHYIMRYSDSCEPPLSEVTEWFKNYMKKE